MIRAEFEKENDRLVKLGWEPFDIDKELDDEKEYIVKHYRAEQRDKSFKDGSMTDEEILKEIKWDAGCVARAIYM